MFKIKSIRRSLLIFIAIAITLVVVYSLAFLYIMHTFEGKSYDFYNSLYWVITTMVTLGSGDIRFVTDVGEIFVIIVSLTGIVLFFAILIPVVVAPIAQSVSETVPTKSRLKDHVLIIGYNSMVETLVNQLKELQIPFLVVEYDKDTVKELIDKKLPCIFCSHDEETTLKNGNIEVARKVVLNRGDEENAITALIARHLTKADIIGLVEDMSNAIYLRYAGANKVISPKQLLGINIGRRAAMPITHQLASSTPLIGNLRLAELSVHPESGLSGRSIAEAKLRELTGATIVGLWAGSTLNLNPSPNEVITENSVLILMGTKKQLDAAKELSICRVDGTSCAILGHYIIAGYGDAGKRVSKVLRSKGIEHLIVIDKKRGDIVGTSTDINVLKEARISEASALIVTVNNDTDSVYTTLVARKLNSKIDIICRAVSPLSVDRLYRAGADYVLSQSVVAGQMLAKFIEPGYATRYEREILLSEDLKVIEHQVGPSLIGKSIANLKIRSRTGCTVIAIKYDEHFAANPDPNQVIREDSIIVIIGSREQIHKFRDTFD
ncbi:MAG TPA: NAD-binding protein [Candidatus Acidoferrum sp.]|nr:NAD-binding protein [Candidatus Acidoferrum sp.]